MSRRLSNGRSPLVRKQIQITSFFSTPTPNSKSNSSPSSKSKKPSSNPCPDPSPSSSVLDKHKKPSLPIPPSKTPSPPIKPKTPSSAETKPQKSNLVGRRIKVYWPLDKAWYTGQLKSYDPTSGKHLIQYDDGEEESILLEKEKTEWIKEEPPKKLRRLRKLSDRSEINQERSQSEELELECNDDDSSDEDWGKNVGKESSDADSEEVQLEEEEDEDEDEEEEVAAVRSRKGRSTSSQSTGKRKKIDVSKMGCAKRFKFEGDEEKSLSNVKDKLLGIKATPVIWSSNNQSQSLSLDIWKCELFEHYLQHCFMNFAFISLS